MHVDPAGDDVTALGVDDFCAVPTGGLCKSLGDLGDLLTLDSHVRLDGFVGIYDGSIRNDGIELHGNSTNSNQFLALSGFSFFQGAWSIRGKRRLGVERRSC